MNSKKWFHLNFSKQHFKLLSLFPWQIFRRVQRFCSTRPFLLGHTTLLPQSQITLTSSMSKFKKDVPLSFFSSSATLWDRLLDRCFHEYVNLDFFKSMIWCYLSSLPTTFSSTYFIQLSCHYNFDSNHLAWLALKPFIWWHLVKKRKEILTWFKIKNTFATFNKSFKK